MSACVCVYMYVYMYACMYVCMHACMHACMYVCEYVDMYRYVECTCMYLHVFDHMRVPVYSAAMPHSCADTACIRIVWVVYHALDTRASMHTWLFSFRLAPTMNGESKIPLEVEA